MKFIKIKCEYCKKTFNKLLKEHNRNIKRKCKNYCSRKCVTENHKLPPGIKMKKRRQLRIKHYKKNKHRELTKNKKWRQDHKLKCQMSHRNTKLKLAYGIDLDGYDKLLKSQNYRCKICFLQHKENNKLHVDHNHKTGKIRGLLCKKCNIALGLLNDDKDRCLRLKQYLEYAG